MENLTHTLVGAALGKAGLDKRIPHAVPILIAAANLPDIEVFSGAFGPNYLDYHRGITHSVIGLVGLSALLAGVIRIGSRIAGRDLATKFQFVPLWGVCLVGMITHPLLDLLNDYGLRPWLPFNSHRYYGDLIAIVDPWLWLILGSAVFLMTKSALGRALTAMAGLLASVLIALGAGWLIALRWLLVLGLGLATGIYLKRISINPCRVAFGIALLYLAVTAIFRESVLKSARDVGQWLVWEQVREIDVLPGRPGSSLPWTVVMDTRKKYYIAEVGYQDWRRRPPRFERFEKNLDDPCYLKVLVQPRMAVMQRFARFPSVVVQKSQSGCSVVLRDLRYARKATAGFGSASATVP